MFIKVCGITTAETLQAALQAGADAIGFVFAESPRRISPHDAAELAAEMPADIAKVAVMLHPSAEEWDEVRRVFSPDWLQCDADDYAVLDVPKTIGRFPAYRDRVAVDFGEVAADWPEHILFEGPKSGVGLKPDWDHAAQLARRSCLMLAGGLTPENVREAIIQVRPWGVDVSSGIESSPGVKDPARIAAFIQAAREAEGSHAG
jgi:phosphoribosylanthranilate isomerase